MHNKLLIFLHIPKTAGTSIQRIMWDQYTREQVALLNDGPWLTERLVRLCNEKDSPIKIISGHIPFGIHQLIDRPCSYFTIVRHPIELLVSMYYYILRCPPIPTYQKLVTMNFTEFAESSEMDFLTTNIQTKYLTGMPNRFVHQPEHQYFLWNPGPYPPDLKLAKKHLRQYFAFVGVTEWLQEGITPMCKALGWNRPANLYLENVGINRLPISEIDPHAIEILTKKNGLDFQLYEFAKKLYKDSVL